MLEPVPEDVRPHSVVLTETDEWLVGIPLNMHAMYWWGSFTEWCTAIEPCHFESYTEYGPLIIFRARTSSFRWALHASSGEFRDVRNKRASWRGFLMQNPEVAADIMNAVGHALVSRSETLAPLLQSLRALTDLATVEARFFPEARKALVNVDRALRQLPPCLFDEDGFAN